MFEKRIVKGVDVYEVKHDHWVVEFKDSGKFEGTFKSVLLDLVLDFNFDITEIEYAVGSMLRKNHNAIHFASNGRYMHTFVRTTDVEIAS